MIDVLSGLDGEDIESYTSLQPEKGVTGLSIFKCDSYLMLPPLFYGFIVKKGEAVWL